MVRSPVPPPHPFSPLPRPRTSARTSPSVFQYLCTLISTLYCRRLKAHPSDSRVLYSRTSDVTLTVLRYWTLSLLPCIVMYTRTLIGLLILCGAVVRALWAWQAVRSRLVFDAPPPRRRCAGRDHVERVSDVSCVIAGLYMGPGVLPRHRSTP